MKRAVYSVNWNDYISYCYALAEQLNEKITVNTVIVTAPRGGYIPSSIIAYQLGIDRIFSCGYSSYKGRKKRQEIEIYQELPFFVMEADTIFLIDDIIDTSQTIMDIRSLIRKNTNKPNVYTAAVFVKEKSKINADFFIKVVPDKEWVEFPYDR